jgi:hypothetical protein
LNHPSESDNREVMFLLSAADRTMNSGEPYLAQYLFGGVVGLLSPDSRIELRARLVERQPFLVRSNILIG